MTRNIDVAIIGGGPAGAALGSLVAQDGHDVVLYERKSFPRFHVGESLVPAVNRVLAKLGVLEEMDRLGFPRKHGVQFFSPRGPGRPFYFSEVADEDLHHTWQVLRSDFDAMLLDHAVRAGVEAHNEAEVFDVDMDDEGVSGLRARLADGTEQHVRARVVVDASGQRGIVARRFGERTLIPGLENSAVYAHYRGVRLDEGIDAGSTLIFRLDTRNWLWFIPLPGGVSIGLVAPADDVWSLGGTPAEILETAIESCQPLRERLTDAERTTEVLMVRDFSYRATREGGPGWMLVGDALAFIDPMYSTGLFLTMLSADLGARAVCERLQSGGDRVDMSGYGGEYHVAFDRFLVLVRAFYQEDFRFGPLAAHPIHRQGLVDLLTGLVDTPEAVEVTRAIQEVFDEKITL